MNYAIILAGGKGQRMESDRPKQFMLLQGRPVIVYSIDCFLRFQKDIQLIIVHPSEFEQEIRLMLNKYFPSNNFKFIEGGDTRFQSVKQGLKCVEKEGIVFIHDAARPFIDSHLLNRCLEQALHHGNAIPAIRVKDSLRKTHRKGSEAVDRNLFLVIQTPQTFQYNILQKSFEQTESTSFTDDASVIEKAGYTIHIVEGLEKNIKITTPFDWLLAACIVHEN
ncbi:MAG: 2-C-methyl-D-erythritol 4-phosphate cytidylyltransferase [Chitinophagaceae bacterium]